MLTPAPSDLWKHVASVGSGAHRLSSSSNRGFNKAADDVYANRSRDVTARSRHTDGLKKKGIEDLWLASSLCLLHQAERQQSEAESVTSTPVLTSFVPITTACTVPSDGIAKRRH